MPNHDDLSAEAQERRLDMAAEAELDETDPSPPPDAYVGQILDDVDDETRASWNLRRIRQVLGVSQQQLSERLAGMRGAPKLSQSQIAKMERGERPWRLNEVTAITAALEVNFTELFKGQYKTDDESMALLAARLRWQKASAAEDEVIEHWREVAKKTREAGEILVRVAADLGTSTPEVTIVLSEWFSHQERLQQLQNDIERDVDLTAWRERDARKKRWINEQWRSALSLAETRREERESGYSTQDDSSPDE